MVSLYYPYLSEYAWKGAVIEELWASQNCTWQFLQYKLRTLLDGSIDLLKLPHSKCRWLISRSFRNTKNEPWAAGWEAQTLPLCYTAVYMIKPRPTCSIFSPILLATFSSEAMFRSTSEVLGSGPAVPAASVSVAASLWETSSLELTLGPENETKVYFIYLKQSV